MIVEIKTDKSSLEEFLKVYGDILRRVDERAYRVLEDVLRKINLENPRKRWNLVRVAKNIVVYLLEKGSEVGIFKKDWESKTKYIRIYSYNEDRILVKVGWRYEEDIRLYLHSR